MTSQTIRDNRHCPGNGGHFFKNVMFQNDFTLFFTLSTTSEQQPETGTSAQIVATMTMTSEDYAFEQLRANVRWPKVTNPPLH